MNDQPARMVDMPTSVRGYTFHDDEGEEFVVLNSRLSWEQNRKTYDHEMEHIRLKELDNPNYNEYEEDSL